MEFRVLGPVEVWVAGEQIAVGPPRQRAVLAALVVDGGRLVPVDVIVERVWGENAPDRAPRTLHTYIARLRRLVERVDVDGQELARIVREPGGYALRVDPERVDLHRFQRLGEQGKVGQGGEAGRLASLREAVGLWHGQPLAGVAGEWAERMRHSWQQRYVDVVVSWARAELQAGNPDAVCAPLRELADDHTLVEPLALVMMQSLATAGRGAEALRYYADFRSRLADELGVDPGPELQAAHQALLRGTQMPPPDRAVCRVGAAQPPVGPAQATHRSVTAVTARPTSRHTASDACAPVETKRPRVAGPGGSARQRWRRIPALRWLPVACLAAAATVLSTVLPPRSAGHSPTARLPVAAPPAPVWIARTVTTAPLLDANGRLIRTIPASSAVEVRCRYRGTPHPPWHSDGVEYHVVTPSVGHVPDAYLTFDAAGPGTPSTAMPHCPPSVRSKAAPVPTAS